MCRCILTPNQAKDDERKAGRMSKYEVVVIRWSDEQKKRIKVVAGTFDRFVDAHLFADAYRKHFSATAEIVEYKRV